jgi:hypothetical protein
MSSGRWDRALLDDARAVVVPWLTARCLMLMGFIVAVAASDRLAPGARPVTLGEGLVAWDGTWYRDIASFGYASLPDEGLRFFPLFPLLGKALSVITFGNTDFALILIANVASFALAIGIRRLVRFERGSVALADRAVWVTCLFPAAFVLSWAYAEALWLLAVVIAFWAMRSRRWWWVVGAGLAAGLTRPLGIALAIPVAIELVRVWRDASKSERSTGALAIVSPVVGTGIYMLWVSRNFGDAFLPFTVQSSLRGDSVDPVSRIFDGLSQMFGAERFGDGLHIPFAIGFVILLVLTFRWWPVSYGAFASVVLVAALAADNLNSLERYGLNAFPLALTFAVLLKREQYERVAFMGLAGGMVALSALAWTGAYVP